MQKITKKPQSKNTATSLKSWETEQFTISIENVVNEMMSSHQNDPQSKWTTSEIIFVKIEKKNTHLYNKG